MKRRHVPLDLAQLRPGARLPPVRGPHPQKMRATGQIEAHRARRRSVIPACRRTACRCAGTALDRRARDGVEAPAVVADAPRPSSSARTSPPPRGPPSSAGSCSGRATGGCSSASSPSGSRFAGRGRGIRASPARAVHRCLAVCRVGPFQHVSVLGLLRCKAVESTGTRRSCMPPRAAVVSKVRPVREAAS